jgi:rhamnulokinase
MPSADPSKSYLAFDFGAESGRAILGQLKSGVLTTQEIHRFKNEPVEYGGSLHWDVARLWYEVRKSLSAARDRVLAGMAVDTWGADYALLGEQGELLQNPYHYRDTRTAGIMEKVFRRVPKEDIYRITGIQFMSFNTLYQVFAAARATPGLLQATRKLITIPDLFHFWLTGNAPACEFTNATTTQLVNARKRTWAKDLIARLELPAHLWCDIVEPGTVLGTLSPSIARDSAMAGTPVIAPATHDTASAVAAISTQGGGAFLSSGTWSLVGTEVAQPVITPEAMRLNFTNEGGVQGTTRLLKNVMGLWILQSCRNTWAATGQCPEQAQLLDQAGCEPPFLSLFDPDHESFVRPQDMPVAIRRFCERTQQPAPCSPAGFTRAILESLALKYRMVLSNLEKLTGKRVERIRVIGGGSKNRLLNQFTADASGRTVIAGPAEATAIGNIGVQMLATGAGASLKEVRGIIERSYPVEVFEPLDTDKWDQQAERFEHYCEVVYA